MRKELLTKRINLNKETISNLDPQEMRESRAGGDKTELGVSCDTGNTCCLTIPPRSDSIACQP
jgi:hypothetical protein